MVVRGVVWVWAAGMVMVVMVSPCRVFRGRVAVPSVVMVAPRSPVRDGVDRVVAPSLSIQAGLSLVSV